MNRPTTTISKRGSSGMRRPQYARKTAPTTGLFPVQKTNPNSTTSEASIATDVSNIGEDSSSTGLSRFKTTKPKRGGIPLGAIYQARQKQGAQGRSDSALAGATDTVVTTNNEDIASSPRSTAPSPEPVPPAYQPHTGVGRATASHRQRRLLRDNIQGITQPDIRRLARRGGVRRVQKDVYGEVRRTLKARLRKILEKVVAFTEHQNRKTVHVLDVVYALNALGSPVAGFGSPSAYIV